jgi:vacuolar-type H+-ATPase subunit I/STV1
MTDDTTQVEESEVNEPTPYQGEYKRHLDDPDPESEDTSVQEATPQQEGFLDQKSKPEHDYKKRYDDLKSHYDRKLNEWKQEQETLTAQLKANNPENVQVPKTAEELEQFKQNYPDVYDIVETISMQNADSRVQNIEERLQVLKEQEQEAIQRTAEQELLSLHPDFPELKSDEAFAEWLKDQPESIADGVLKNGTDFKWAARVIDLYKADSGTVQKKTKGRPSKAAESVTKTQKRTVQTKGDKKIWTISEIEKMKPWEFEKYEKDIDQARREGRLEP